VYAHLKEKGLDGGYDILVRGGDGFRIDSAVGLGGRK
jgi:hypothetical protein